jgi:hypothetical protein
MKAKYMTQDSCLCHPLSVGPPHEQRPALMRDDTSYPVYSAFTSGFSIAFCSTSLIRE